MERKDLDLVLIHYYADERGTANTPSADAVVALAESYFETGIFAGFAYSGYKTKPGQRDRVEIRQYDYGTGKTGKLYDWCDCRFTTDDIRKKVEKLDPNKPRPKIAKAIPNTNNWRCWLADNWLILMLLFIIILALVKFVKTK